jgi:hypothetical protein
MFGDQLEEQVERSLEDGRLDVEGHELVRIFGP